MTSAKIFSVESLATTDNYGEEECGDTATTFENCDDRFYAIVSDGMGTGREAAFTSGVASIFLRKMLGTGNRASTVIKMLSGFIRSKPEECSASADIMELDLLTGRAEFLKCGAAASFVRRRDNLFKLASATLPLGILSSTDAGRLTFDVEDGDVIIMMSDGVAMGNEDCMWLLDMLTTEWDDDLRLTTRRLIDRARKSGSRDDISVILTKVSAVKGNERTMPKTEKRRL
jgi:stage II sporulation protein E